MSFTMLVLVLHAAVTWALTGLIWFVQVVHYPLFAAVGSDQFAAYHAAHNRLTTLVVAPLMLVEAGAALWLLVHRTGAAWLAWTGAALILVVWLVTFGVSVPRHNALARGGLDVNVIGSLVATNWVRTVAWTVRAVLAAWLLLSAAPRPETLH